MGCPAYECETFLGFKLQEWFSARKLLHESRYMCCARAPTWHADRESSRSFSGSTISVEVCLKVLVRAFFSKGNASLK